MGSHISYWQKIRGIELSFNVSRIPILHSTLLSRASLLRPILIGITSTPLRFCLPASALGDAETTCRTGVQSVHIILQTLVHGSRGVACVLRCAACVVVAFRKSALVKHSVSSAFSSAPSVKRMAACQTTSCVKNCILLRTMPRNRCKRLRFKNATRSPAFRGLLRCNFAL